MGKRDHWLMLLRFSRWLLLSFSLIFIAGCYGPEALDDSYTTDANTVLTIPDDQFAGVLDNDAVGRFGDNLWVVANSWPEHGTLVISADGSFIYTPDADYSGEDSFTYTVRDLVGSEDTATAYLTIVEPLVLSSPVRIAQAPSGQLVVSEFNAGKVLFLHPGTLVVEGSIDTSRRLAAVGVTNDKVFVGAEIPGAVGVYTYTGQLLYMLGSGVGEFGIPSDLLIDAANERVYVVDSGAKVVKVYNLNDGAFLWNFGQGTMSFPTGIAFDPSSDTLLISDFGVGKAGGGSMSFDPESFYAGIWRYDLDGNYIETITGDFSRPQGLAVDENGIIFLVDSLLGEVLVYQKSLDVPGYEELYREGGGDNFMRLPLDIVIDPSTRNLYVTNNLLGRVEVFPGGGDLP